MGRSKRRKRTPSRPSPAPQRSEKAAAPQAAAPQASEPLSKDQANALPMGFLSLVALAVVFVLYLVRAYSLAAHQAAQLWPAIPCTIVTNDYPNAARSGQERFRFEYEYVIDGQTRRSSELDLIPGEVGDEGHYRRTLARAHPLGSRTVCYADPADPTRAVIDREHMEALGTLEILGLPFLVVGLAMGAGAVASWNRGSSKAGASTPGEESRWRKSVRLFREPQGHLLVIGGIAAGSLFVFLVMDGKTHLDWLIHPASRETQGTIVWVNRTGNREFGFDQRQFEYVYEVEGTAYEGRSYALGPAYELDAAAVVHYDAGTPARSYLASTRSTWSPGWVVWPTFVFVVLMGTLFAWTLFLGVCRVVRG